MSSKSLIQRLVVSLVAGIVLAALSLAVTRGGEYVPASQGQRACTGQSGAQCLAIVGGGPAHYAPLTRGWPMTIYSYEPGDQYTESRSSYSGTGALVDIAAGAGLCFILLSVVAKRRG